MGGLPWGGSEVLWSKTAFEALKAGHKVFVSVYDWGSQTSEVIERLRKEGALIHLREKWRSNESIYRKIRRRLSKKIPKFSDNWKYLLEFAPDSVLISQGDNFDLALHHKELYYILYTNNIPYSFICHNHRQYSEILDSPLFCFAKEVFKNARKVYFVSKMQERLTERKLCMKLENAQFTWNPLNLEKKEYIDWPKNEISQMAIVANLISGKGHDTLLEVLSDQKWKDRNWQLNIYGKGYGKSYLKDLAKWYDIEEKVKFHGHVSSATEIWERNHILLIPSAGEGLPISLIEAAICGRTAVVTDVGGNTEIIEDGINGFVACAPSVKSFSIALEKTWESKNILKEFGQRLHNDFKTKINFNPEVRILNNLLKNE